VGLTFRVYVQAVHRRGGHGLLNHRVESLWWAIAPLMLAAVKLATDVGGTEAQTAAVQAETDLLVTDGAALEQNNAPNDDNGHHEHGKYHGDRHPVTYRLSHHPQALQYRH